MAGVRSFEYYMDRYTKGVSYTRNIEYDNRKSVSKNNLGVDMYRKAARSIGKYYPDKVNTFARMLDSTDKTEREICAICLIEFMNPNKEMTERSLRVIKDKALHGDAIDKTLVRYWIKQHAPQELEDYT